MDGGTFFLVLILWIGVWGGIGAAIGSGKGRTGEGFILGALLGIIGIIIVAVMSPSREVEQARDARFARTLNSMAPKPPQPQQSSTPAWGPPPAVNVPPRQHLMAEAINRDPTLANPSDPETLKRLNQVMDDLAVEHQTRAELESLMALQQGSSGALAAPGSYLARAADPAADGDTLWKLIRSEDLSVAIAAAKNPSLPGWVARRTLRETSNEQLRSVLQEVVDNQQE